jgi:hypothetical protein
MKNQKVFYNLYYNVHYHLTKYQIEIQLVYGETKKTNYVNR